ncbi:MAG: hypothetical protein E7256_11490 [Lachnospiraceae bacterium]|nr:hypothetical protein [Lachnospiraceae bacterium]
MCVELMKYHGSGDDYLIYDPVKNQMNLNAAQVKLIFNRSLVSGSEGILVGPIYEGDQCKVHMFRQRGTKKKTRNGYRIFLTYLKDQGYEWQKSEKVTLVDAETMKEENMDMYHKEVQVMQASLGEEEEQARSVGKVMLFDSFVDNLKEYE